VSKPESEMQPEAAPPAEDNVAKPDGPPQDAADWRDAIGDPKMRAFADRMASPSDAVKMAFDLRRKLSRGCRRKGNQGVSQQARRAGQRRGLCL